MSIMSPIKTKNRRIESMSPTMSEVIIPGLPDDVALNVLARVPRCYHPVLAAVSKRIRSVVTSPDLFAIRSRLNCAEDQIYLIADEGTQTPTEWFVVHRKPGGDVDGPILAPIPSGPLMCRPDTSAYAVVGPKIYVLGGITCEGRPSSDVWVLDCRSHAWERGQSMRMGRAFASAAVVDGRIYVMGGCVVKEDAWARETHWVETLDLVAAEGGGRWEWEGIPSSAEVHSKNFVTFSNVMGGGICFWAGGEEFRFDPATKAWEKWVVFGSAGREIRLNFYEVPPLTGGERSSSEIGLRWDFWNGWQEHTCVVDGVLYFFGRFTNTLEPKTIKWFDETNREWKELEGLVATDLPEHLGSANMVNFGGRLVIIGDVFPPDDDYGFELWYYEIEVKRIGNGRQLSGRVLSSQELPPLPLVLSLSISL